MNAQEIFDTVVAHLVSMKDPSTDDEGMCSYRGKNGSKCAAGILIPDEYYDLEMEELSFIDVCISFNLPEYLHLDKNIRLISYLQSAHDNIANWDDNGPNDTMKTVLKTIAQKFNLNEPNF